LVVIKPCTKFRVLSAKPNSFMKKIITFVLITFLAFTSYAQGGKRKGGARAAAANQIEASQVPDVVKKAFTIQAADMHWEKVELQGKAGKVHVHYVAVYTQDGTRVRARFKEDGAAMGTSRYMGAQKLPEVIQSAAKAKNPGAVLRGGEEFTKGDQVFYRVRLKNGSSKITSVFDASGAEVTKDKIAEEMKHGEEEDGGN
jgi:hypothetical protein